MDSEKKIDGASKETSVLDKCLSVLKVRYGIVALLFFGSFVGYASRVILSIAIVPMNNSTNPDFPSFHWNEEGVEGLVLSSFFWGYCIGQIPGGMLVQMWGSKWPLFGAMTVSFICVILTPLAAIYGGWIATCTARVLQGASQATLYPALHGTIAVWIPMEERGRLVTIILCGAQIGTIVALTLGGYLSPSPGGWPSIFYVFGGLGLTWCLLWCFFGYSSPSEHPFISPEERNLIESSISNKFETKLKTPWRALLTSLPVWALIISQCTQNFGFWTLMTEIPTYMDSALEFKIQDNGVLSGLPFFVMAILSFVFGWMADFAFRKNWLSVEASRKFFNTLGFWIPAAALVWLGFITKEQQAVAVVLLVVAIGFNAGNYAGFSLGFTDLSPNFSGMIMGICNCAANVFSTVGTLLADEIIKKDKKSIKNWQIVFSLTAAIYFLGNLIYIFIGKADRQPWNEPDYEREVKVAKVTSLSQSSPGAAKKENHSTL